MRALHLAVLVAAVLALAPQARAQQVDVIRGQVTGPDGEPVASATVTATSVSGGVNRSARTDDGGRFTITFPGGEGDYYMGVVALGFTPRRFEVKRTADQEILVADTRMARASALLDTVRVAAGRDRVRRNDNAPDIGGSEQASEAPAVTAAQQGDLNAMAGTIPGVTPVLDANGDPAGFSVLGLSADQNSTTLNGSPFASSSVPRDANVTTTLVMSPYDVSRGGFSGAQFNVRPGGASNFIRRALSLNFDAPPLQWTDPTARALGQQYTNASLGGSVSGPIVFDAAFYNMSWQLGRRSSDLHTLFNTSAPALQASGISADSVKRLLGILAAQGVPSSAGSPLAKSRLSDQGSVFASFDVTPPGSSTAQTWNATLNGNWGRQTPAMQLLGELPAHGGDRTNWSGGLQVKSSAYIHNTILTETTVGANRSRNYGTPYAALPNASVLVNSSFADGTSGVRSIGFGGNPFIGTSSTSDGFSVDNQLSWFSTNNKHRLKLTTELRRDQYSQDQTTNALGSFVFASLADLEANRPAYYTRTLSPRVQSAGQTVLGMSLGDSYKWSSNLQLQYGVRLDGNRFSATPAENADVERIFGARNDVVPNKLYVSPRLGFSWSYGEAPQIAAFDGAVRGPRAVVRGGIGIFQNTTGATLVGNAIDNTGLPGAVQQLTCVGPAAPVPDWGSYVNDPATVPAQCAGSSGSPFASTVPNVTLFSPGFEATRSLRSNLQWNGPVASNRFSATVDVTWSRNMNQASLMDLNFDGVTRFTLANEADRPVFVQPGSIIPQTGAIASRDARVTQLFARVSEQRSDLRSETRQLRVSLFPTNFSSDLTWSASYVLSSVREQVRGFSSTAGDPRAVEWSRGSMDGRHQLTYSIGYNVLDAVRVNWFGRFQSGTPYTPSIAGDVNGDGYGNNDRAFVYDPATTTDPTLAAAVRDLLANGSSSARDCLSRQLGALSARNSCEGPWTSSANLSIAFNPAKVRLPQRATLSLAISNPLGAADLLLHGENGLHGWGQQAFADPTLLYVRGFDPVAQRYTYQVNQRFGSTNPQFNTFRQPVTLTMQVRVDVGPSRERQVLTQQLDRGRKTAGTRTAEPMLKAMYGSGGIMNPMAQLLRQSDTLELTGPQADSLATMNRAYTVRLDSIWAPAAKYLASVPEHYDQGEAFHRYTEARRASVDALIALAPRISALLTDEQKRKLPPLVASHLDTRYLAGIRSGTQGNSAGGVFIGNGMFIPSGGGGEQVIIRH